MRVTILSGSVPTTTFIDGLINTIASEGFQVTVIGRKVGDYDYHDNVSAICVPISKFRRVLFILSLLPKINLKSIIKIYSASRSIKNMYNNLVFYLPMLASKPDKVHVQWAAFLHNKELLFDLFKDKVVVSLRGAHINYTPILNEEIKESYLRLFPKVHRFHAVCNDIVSEAKKYNAAQDKIDVVYSFVKDSVLDKEVSIRKRNKPIRIVSVGRFFWKKGFEYALDALALLKKEGFSFSYTIIASGDVPDAIKYQIHDIGIAENVTIINGMQHEGALSSIEEHDVLLLTSVEEGVPNVMLEAMALGTIVVATDVGGVLEVIEDGCHGYIAESRNIQNIADCIKKVINLTDSEYVEVIKNAKQKVREKHNRQKFTEQISAFYKK